MYVRRTLYAYFISHMYAGMHLHKQSCIHTLTHNHNHTYIYIYIHSHIHKHVHTHTHMEAFTIVSKYIHIVWYLVNSAPIRSSPLCSSVLWCNLERSTVFYGRGQLEHIANIYLYFAICSLRCSSSNVRRTLYDEHCSTYIVRCFVLRTLDHIHCTLLCVNRV